MANKIWLQSELTFFWYKRVVSSHDTEEGSLYPVEFVPVAASSIVVMETGIAKLWSCDKGVKLGDCLTLEGEGRGGEDKRERGGEGRRRGRGEGKWREGRGERG